MSKSRAERSGKTPSGNQASSNNTQNAIVPGKFMEADWHDLIEDEQDDNFIDDIVHEIADVACQKIFQNIIESRLKPYAVFSAKELLLEIIKLRFLESEKQEDSTMSDLSWLEDDEPLACVTDSWAQGAVPVLRPPIQTTSNEEDIVTLTESETEKSTNENELDSNVEDVNIDKNNNEEPTQLAEVQEKEDGKKQGDSLTNKESSAVTPHPPNSDTQTPHPPNSDALTTHLPNTEVVTPHPPSNENNTFEKSNCKKSPSNRIKKYKPHNGSLPKFQPILPTSVIDETPKPSPVASNKPRLVSSDSFTTNQYGRPKASKEVVYDDEGNIVHIQRFNVAKLRSHRVATKYSVVETDNDNSKKVKLLTRKNKNIKTQRLLKLQNEYMHQNMVSSAPLLQRLYDVADLKSDLGASDSLYSPLPPSLIDTVEISNGVTVREGGLSRQGPKKKNMLNPSESHLLLPLGSAATHVIDVKDIVTHPTPGIKSLNHQKPLPSIKS